MQLATTQHEENTVERRSSYRHQVCVPCTVRADDGIELACNTENIGIGGALLRADNAREVGVKLGLDIHFPWARTVTAAATVHRIIEELAGGARLAIRFDHPVHDSRLSLKQAIELKWTSHDSAVGASSLIMVDDPTTRVELCAAISELGVRPLIADMPDQALWHLTGEGNGITSVIVDAAMFGERTLEWCTFLREVYPHVRRVMVRKQVSRWRMAQLLSSGALDGLIDVPWERSCLEDLVQTH
jgi:hypothetical protein